MKKILGLDLGSASIGWAVIAEDSSSNETKPQTHILGLGSRIIPYEGTEGKDFEKGTGESRSALRTKARTTRKMYDRYQLRRKNLVNILVRLNMMPTEKEKLLTKMELWELRSKAANQKISLAELGRILLWLNQKRGYKSGRSEANMDKKDTDYVATVKSRHDKIKELGLTIGQYFYQKLKNDEFFRIKENVFPREAYTEEYYAICNNQKKYYPALTDELIEEIDKRIIYYQRKLKSQKGLVAVCDFEGFWVKKKTNGVEKEYFVGPKVAHKSSPLFQAAKMWENINNIRITNQKGDQMVLTENQKQKLYDHLDNNEKLTLTDLVKILGLKKDDCYFNKQLIKGLQGNTTKQAIIKCIDDTDRYKHLLKMDFNIVGMGGEGYLYDKKTGEILNIKPLLQVDNCIEKEPFYQLWHSIYSSENEDESRQVLQTKFKIDEMTANKLAALDFKNKGYGDKSAKVIRRILPYLMQGDGYSEAMSYAGYDHSNSLTKDQNLERKLLDKLKPIPKNSLRQPIVEKILNQMVNLVNALIDKYAEKDEEGNFKRDKSGNIICFDEIRVELARELKQSKQERNETEKFVNQREKENKIIAERLAEFGLRATRNNIIKWRLYQEIDNEDQKLNAICIYCGQPISLTEAIMGNEVDIEHIIPKAKLFDDSQSNKTLAHRRCNANKDKLTAYDFMKGKSNSEFEAYIERVNTLYKNKVISKSKKDKLLMTESKIPDNFIDRQLRESQYISKKAREILQTVCHHVWATSGNVTAELRHLWGWDDVTMNLQLPKYKSLSLTEIREWESDHNRNSHRKEVIKDWTKRDDHRHHAVDALTIACTRQGFIQRFNTLNSKKTRDDMYAEVAMRSDEFKEKLTLLEKYIITQQPISVAEVEKAVSQILVSFKSGKRVAVLGKRKVGKRGKKKVAQTGIVVPRGALSEESVYGKIKVLERQKVNFLFENPDLIFKSYIRELVKARLGKFDGDKKKAIASLKKDPIFLDKEQTKKLEFATCFRDEYVIKYKVDVNFTKIDKVIDKKIRDILQNRLNKFGNKPKEAFKDIQKEDKTIIKWYEDEGLERPILSVRCSTGLSAVVPVKKDDQGNDIGFVKPGNNHHIAIYSDANGNKIEHICTFWHAVERKKYGFPVIIKNTNEIWDRVNQSASSNCSESFLRQLPAPGLSLILSLQQNEMLVLGMTKEDFDQALQTNNKKAISESLYVVWSLSENDYWFKHHLETKGTDLKKQIGAKEANRFYRKIGINPLFSLNPQKVFIDCLGNISPNPGNLKNQMGTSEQEQGQVNEPQMTYAGAGISFFNSLEEENEATSKYMAERTPEESLRAANLIITAMYRKELENTDKPYTNITFLNDGLSD